MATVVWDVYLNRYIGKLKARIDRRHRQPQVNVETASESIELTEQNVSRPAGLQQRVAVSPTRVSSTTTENVNRQVRTAQPSTSYDIPVWSGIVTIVCFFGNLSNH